MVWPQQQEGLIFIWANNQQPNPLADAAQIKRSWPIALQGKARYNDDQALVLDEGGQGLGGAGEPMLQSFLQTNAVTIEAVINHITLNKLTGAHHHFFRQHNKVNFTLGQSKSRLVLRIRTPATNKNAVRLQQDLAQLQVNKQHHVVVTYVPGQTTCYIDGLQVYQSEKEKRRFEYWSPAKLIFGAEAGGSRDIKISTKCRNFQPRPQRRRN